MARTQYPRRCSTPVTATCGAWLAASCSATGWASRTELANEAAIRLPRSNLPRSNLPRSDLAGDTSLPALILKARAAEERGDAIWYGGGNLGSVPAYCQSVAMLEDAVRRYPAMIHGLRRLGHASLALASALADSDQLGNVLKARDKDCR